MYVTPLKAYAKITKPFAYDQGHIVGVVSSIHLCSNLLETSLFSNYISCISKKLTLY